MCNVDIGNTNVDNIIFMLNFYVLNTKYYTGDLNRYIINEYNKCDV